MMRFEEKKEVEGKKLEFELEMRSDG